MDQRDAVTTDIQNFIKKSGNNVFFLTSRPEKALASFGEFIEFQIKPLKKEEAYDLLRRYDRTGKVSEALITKLKDPDFSNIEEFLETPLLVSLLFTAYEYKQTIPFKKHVFYRQVYDALFDSHDLSKGDSFIRTKKANLGIDDFHSILRHVGYVCMKLGRIEFTKDEILNHIKKSKEFNIGKQFKESDFLEDIITNVPLFNKDGLYYRWAHKSIQEYFAAQFIYLDSKENQEKILTSLFNSKEFLRFYNVLDLYYDIDYKSFRKGIIFPFALEYLDFCSIKISSISKEDVIKRRTILFTINEAFLIRMEAGQKGQILKSDDNEYDPDGLCPRAFSLARIQVKQEPELSVVAFKGGYKHLNNTLIMLDSRDTYRNFQLTRLLKAKREDIVTTFVSSQESLITVNGLEQDKLYSLSDISTESPINDPKEFKKVNDLFTIFASSPLVLDYKKTKELAENIQAELNSCDDSFFVDGF